MAETRSQAVLNESIVSLCKASDHHAKDIEEIHKITHIHTRTLNEMNQQLNAILQKLNSLEATRQRQTPRNHEIQSNTSTILAIPKPLRLEFPRFSGEEPTGWVYKANQYFRYYNTTLDEQLLLASFHMDGEALVLVPRRWRHWVVWRLGNLDWSSTDHVWDNSLWWPYGSFNKIEAINNSGCIQVIIWGFIKQNQGIVSKAQARLLSEWIEGWNQATREDVESSYLECSLWVG